MVDDVSRGERPSVFVSYARADRAKVARIVAALEAAGYEVWWDRLIEGGTAFATAIEARLNGADAVIVVWSATSVASDWVRDEAAHARDRHRLAPISLDGTPAPLGFRQYHVIDFAHWRGDARGEAMQSLIRCLAKVADAPSPLAANPSSAGRQPARLSRRAALIGGGAAAVAVVGGVAAWRPWTSEAAGNSVAVLPFANLSGDASQAYFSDGLAEELRAALARNETLRVAAPTSSNMFRGRLGDAKTIADKLGVAYLLEGSVRKSGRVVRVAADLIDAATGFTSWSQTFDRTIDDIFAVQSEIADTVAGALAVRVSRVPPPGGTTKLAAYDAYLRGRALFNADDGEASDRAALAQFDAAVAADPGYASAHAARSRSLAGIATQYADVGEARAMHAAAITAARRAIAIAPGLAAGQLALGYALFAGKLDIRAARAPFDRAYALGKGDADILLLFALYCARTRRGSQARQAVDSAVQLDPLNPRAYRAAASVRYAGRDYAGAIPLARRALQLNPRLSNAHALIGIALMLQGHLREARAMLVEEPNTAFRLAGLAIVERKEGDAVAADKALADLRGLGDRVSYQQAQVLAQTGDRDAALAALDRARTIGDSGLVYLGTDPLLDPLRTTPRFVALLSGIGFD